MYNGKFSNPPKKHTRRRRSRRTPLLTVVAVLLLLATAVGGTLAFLTDDSTPVTNTFTPSQVSCRVEEKFDDGKTKQNVNVTNTSDIPAYLRVKLISYRINDDGDRIGGTATVPSFNPGYGWVLHEGYYYYTQPVAPGEKPATDLISSITLEGNYEGPDGGKQVIEVMAEAIQADGVGSTGQKAVEIAWGVDPETLR